MKREHTNIIRTLLDEFIPPIIRDNKFFMYPFFIYAFRNKNIKQAMEFKSLASQYSSNDFHRLYSQLDCISRDRLTDLNHPMLQHINNYLSTKSGTLLDVGSGSDFFINQLSTKNISPYFSDIALPPRHNRNFIQADIENLPFKSNSFDYVTCFHTIEHLLNPKTAVDELTRVAKKEVIIATPCQRYYYYTLDLHLQFFPQEHHLTSLFNFSRFNCTKISGDWLYIGYKS